MPHIHEKIDFTVEAFIVHNNKVLLRKHDKYKLWLSIGGHIELDEDPLEAVVREAKEEVGLDITVHSQKDNFVSKDEPDVIDKIPPVFMYRHHTSPTHEHVCFVYFATTNTSEVIPGDNESKTDIRWFTMDDLNKNDVGITDRILFYAKNALQMLSK